MQFRGRKRTTATAVAVIGGLLAGGLTTAPGVLAAPSPAPTAGRTPDPDGKPGAGPGGRAPVPAQRPVGQDSAGPPPAGTAEIAAAPVVWPRPQSLDVRGAPVRLGTEAVLVAPAGTDPYALDVLRGVLREAGVTTLREWPASAPPPAGAVVVRAQGPDAEAALRALGAAEAGDLPAGGYRLAVGRHGGRDTVALAGTGTDGLFHAAQTLRQLVRGPQVPAVLVRDWPSAAVRGTAEGFYGQPWSHGQRLAHLDFMARTKQNRYLYAPGDDPFRTSRWREAYPQAQQAEFRAFAQRARAVHVTPAWAVAPGQTMCLSSADDRAALLRKVDAMAALGFGAFQLQFQDVSYTEWGCRADRERYGRGPAAAARAHADLAGELAAHLARRHPGAAPLSVVPTEYYQDGATPYRTALAAALDRRVQVAWTGIGVVPRTITGRELAGAREVFRHPLVTMDNYPVNDYAHGRLFLGPYTGREPAVANGSAALLANAMPQAVASRIPLFTAADFAWNARSYRADASWRAALDDLAGGDARAREALGALAGNTSSSVLDRTESAYLRPLLAEFWQARAGADRKAGDLAGDRLRAAFTVMREARARLGAAADGTLTGEAGAWVDQLARYGTAGELAVDLLRAQAHGDGAAAWRARLALRTAMADVTAADGAAVVGRGVLGAFLAKAVSEADAWTGASRKVPGASVARAPGSYTVRLDRARPVEAVTVMTDPAAGAGRGTVLEAHVPGQGWRRLGEASPSGWTQAAAAGLRADAVRLLWAGDAPAVHRVVPWFADEPAARFELGGGGRADAEIGGRPQRVAAELSAVRPGAVKGALTAKAPHGIKVEVPAHATVPRGGQVSVPVEVTVPEGTPAGVYEVPVSFGGESRTLTVRAFPKTGGADLARGAQVLSSGDETADFPAAAAVDGDPATRWSSPAADGAWWQMELPTPVRLGQLVLTWQDAYASAYRVETSADGVSWRTAATVTGARGGREAVRMDEPGVRFVRVRGDVRATPYGISLFSVEAYAVVP
ncbi:beta-N-acetylglucosaminidase domain-containing protein [Streptomyces bambusae]|uniref:beta-N-acetylglucosaminidase domain-containing protein n=1 Tax=Streptomyces bambusae TaxID=1550616 RepID=UPI001CFFE3FF|nr:beta-N-acetylglucosaminidase domain-containing protein [Streptomyces bambusae]MCB5169755.1 beta-N-acetylglucosaminidase domain-containing protein [Streptomyces bambusae]